MKRSHGAKTLIYPTPTWIVGSYDAQGKRQPFRVFAAVPPME